MGNFTTTHVVNGNADVVAKLILSSEVLEGFYRQQLRCLVFQFIDASENESSSRVLFQYKPSMVLPAPVAKLFGPNLFFRVERQLSKATGISQERYQPSLLADKIKWDRRVRIQGGAQSTMLSCEESFRANVFAVGGLIESSFEKSIREENAMFCSYLNTLIARNSL